MGTQGTARLLILAGIEVAQGFLGALAYGLDHLRRSIEREQRQQARAKRMADSVRADLERLP